MPEKRSSETQTLAAIGNAVALITLLLVLSNAGRIFQEDPNGTAGASSRKGTEALGPAPSRLMLILLDGLRADVAVDRKLMPNLNALAAKGSRGIANVEALLPSTISGLRSIVEGRQIAPAQTVFDFTSPAADRAGFLQTNRLQGARNFVAAPKLWGDLYGAWIDKAVLSDEIDGEDQRLLEATLAELSRGEARVVAVHFSHPDLAAHLAGGASPRYRAAVAWCDDAVLQLVASAGDRTATVITSDHGVTDLGGHAGPELEVRRVPVIAYGYGSPRLPQQLSQRSIAEILRRTLGEEPAVVPRKPLALTPPLPPRGHSQRRVHRRELPPGLILAGTVLFSVLGASIISAQASEKLAVNSGMKPHRHFVGKWKKRMVFLSVQRSAFWLSLAFWSAAAATLLSLGIGFMLAATAVIGVAMRSRPGRFVPVFGALLLGAGCGAYRLIHSASLLAGGQQQISTSALGTCLTLVGALTAGWLIAWLVSREWETPDAGSTSQGSRSIVPAVSAGALALLFGELVLQPAGGSVSLSALDIQTALRWGLRLESLTVAITLAAVQPFLPHLGLLITSILVILRNAPALFAPFSAGVGAALLGEAACAAIAFIVHVGDLRSSGASLALCLLVRSFAEVLLVFPLMAGSVWFITKVLTSKLAKRPLPS